MIASVGTLMSVTLKVNYFVFWGKSTEDIEACEKDVPLSRKAAMILGALACIITGLFPDLIYSLTPYGTDGHPFYCRSCHSVHSAICSGGHSLRHVHRSHEA